MTTLTDTGRGLITGYMITSTSKYVGWGKNTGATAESHTNVSLDSEVNTSGASGVSRSGTNSPTQQTTTVANDTYQVIQTITAAAAVTIAEAGLFNSTSVGNMMLRGVFSGIPLSSGDSIQFTFRLSFS